MHLALRRLLLGHKPGGIISASPPQLIEVKSMYGTGEAENITLDNAPLAGDYLLAFAMGRSFSDPTLDITLSTASGNFSQLSNYVEAGFDHGVWLGSKVANGSEGTNYNFIENNGVLPIQTMVAVFRGVSDAGTPVVVSGDASTLTSSSLSVAANSLAVNIYGLGASYTSSPPSGWTEQLESQEQISIWLDTKEITSAGTEPAVGRTISESEMYYVYSLNLES